MTIRELLKKTDEQLAALTDKEVTTLAYGIRYFDFGVAGITPTERHRAVMSYLSQRLTAIGMRTREDAAVQSRPAVRMVECDCGHTIPAHMMMSASRGTTCPDCYDRMSE